MATKLTWHARVFVDMGSRQEYKYFFFSLPYILGLRLYYLSKWFHRHPVSPVRGQYVEVSVTSEETPGIACDDRGILPHQILHGAPEDQLVF